MTFPALFLLAVALAADAFAVSLVQGVRMKTIRPAHLVAVAGTFGIFQGVMPIIGWAIGEQIGGFIVAIDHWVVFGLLGVIGLKMIKDAIWPGRETTSNVEMLDETKLDIRGILLLAIATSIDALAVGLSFALIDVNIFGASTVIALVTFVVSAVGVVVGHRFGIRFRLVAEILGGLVLIGIGANVLIEHLLG